MRGDARALPLPDDSVDLVVTSPPYYGLRDYIDRGECYAGQLGAEATRGKYVDALLDVTRECLRVLRPAGSLWINLGDRYSGKSLAGVPWRYAIRCTDDLGLILRAEIVWSKPNGLPEPVTDRVRRSHEQWFHLVQQPRYYAAVDEIRRPYDGDRALSRRVKHDGTGKHEQRAAWHQPHPLGSLPGSVWEIPSQPLHVPARLGVDHYAAFPMAWPRRIITGWSPREVCTACGHGRRPVTVATGERGRTPGGRDRHTGRTYARLADAALRARRVDGYRCACPQPTAPTRPGVVLDPCGGTGTTALVAAMHGRTGITVDASGDYCQLARWRTRDPRERARAAGLDPDEVARVESHDERQGSLLDLLADEQT